MKKIVYDTAVIGAGASGLLAAIAAARSGVRVILLEHMDQAAKKLLATGNGKCNYTNADQTLDHYYCEEPDFLRQVFEKFSYQDTIRFFEELGIRPLQKNGTCIYPESEQAASVKSVLLAETERLHIPLLLSAGIRAIHKRNLQHGMFEIETKENRIYSRTCILAAGGKAAKKTGSDGSGYIYARQMGHTIREPQPALAALLADYKDWRLPAGMRISCTASLYVEGKMLARERGELQVTDYGISGIVIFQFSRIAAMALAENRQVQVFLDFKPDLSERKLTGYLTERFSSIFHRDQSMEAGLIGFLPDQLIPLLLKRAGIRVSQAGRNCSVKQTERLTRQMKNYTVRITGSRGFDFAQATAGGVPVQEIHANSMESGKVPGFYFAGEIVDVDAKCGGYNLQWAWSSGFVAGKSAAERIMGKNDKDSADQSTCRTQQTGH